MRVRAFTLLEILVSVALVGALAGGLFSFFLDLSRTRDRIAASARESNDAAVAFDRIEADLTCAIAGSEGLGAGVAGDVSSLTVLTRAVSVAAAGVVDLQRCQYSFGGGALSTTRTPLARGGGGEGASETLVEGLGLVRFRYFDGRVWVEAFDSLEEGALPVAVEVAVWFAARGPARIGSGMEEPGTPMANTGAEAEWAPEDQGGPEDFGGIERLREPDRLRVLIVPDGPVAAWREGS